MTTRGAIQVVGVAATHGLGHVRRRRAAIRTTATTASSSAHAPASPSPSHKVDDGTADLPEQQDGIDGEGSQIGSLTRAIVALDEEDRAGEAEALLDAILRWATDVKGMTLYEAQEEAIMELVEGNSVLLATPTGSGKTLVATAAIAAAAARGEVGRVDGTERD